MRTDPVMAPAPRRSLMERYWKEVSTAAVLLGGLGYVVISPKEQIDRLTTRIEQSITAQQARDASQDDRFASLKGDTEEALRRVSADLSSLIIARCISEKNAAVYAQLNCKSRLGR